MRERTKINKDELLEEIYRLLSVAEIPKDAQLTYINHMVDDSRYDMNLKMDIMEYSVKFFMYERGKIIYEKLLEDEQDIIYIVLENVAAMYSASTVIDLDDEDQIKDEIFAKIGEPYLTMYQNEIDIFSY